ncbi:hypothetical protein ACA910_018515 [Epithemia clementina (nom. ined.)]
MNCCASSSPLGVLFTTAHQPPQAQELPEQVPPSCLPTTIKTTIKIDQVAYMNNLAIRSFENGLFYNAVQIYCDTLCHFCADAQKIEDEMNEDDDDDDEDNEDMELSEFISPCLFIQETQDLLLQHSCGSFSCSVEHPAQPNSSLVSTSPPPCTSRSSFPPLSFLDHNTLMPHKAAFLFFNAESLMEMSDADNNNNNNSSTRFLQQHQRRRRHQLILGSLLFNFGLIYHLQALQQKGGSEETRYHLQRAHSTYGMAEQALLRYSADFDECYDDAGVTERRLLLAVYNNKACISFQFWNLADCERQLISLRYILGTCCGGNDSNAENETDMDDKSFTPLTLGMISEDDDHCRHFFWNAISMAKLAMTSPAA